MKKILAFLLCFLLVVCLIPMGVSSNTYISYAQIGGCILSCDEVNDYNSLLVNNSTENIEVQETSVPVLGVISVV